MVRVVVFAEEGRRSQEASRQAGERGDYGARRREAAAAAAGEQPEGLGLEHFVCLS